MKRKDNYYYQCQGLMYVTNSDWIDFGIRTEQPHELHIERIFFNRSMWNTDILPKLTAFYHKALLPDIVVPRHGKSSGIREPGVWVR